MPPEKARAHLARKARWHATPANDQAHRSDLESGRRLATATAPGGMPRSEPSAEAAVAKAQARIEQIRNDPKMTQAEKNAALDQLIADVNNAADQRQRGEDNIFGAAYAALERRYGEQNGQSNDPNGPDQAIKDFLAGSAGKDQKDIIIKLRAAAGADGRLGAFGSASMAAGEQLYNAIKADVEAMGADHELTNEDLLQLAAKHNIDPATLFSEQTNATAQTFATTNYGGAYQQQVAVEQAAAQRAASLAQLQDRLDHPTQPGGGPAEPSVFGRMVNALFPSLSAEPRGSGAPPVRMGQDRPNPLLPPSPIQKLLNFANCSLEAAGVENRFFVALEGAAQGANTIGGDGMIFTAGGKASVMSAYFGACGNSNGETAAILAGVTGSEYLVTSGGRIGDHTTPVMAGFMAAIGLNGVIGFGKGGSDGLRGPSNEIGAAVPGYGSGSLSWSSLPPGETLLADRQAGYLSISTAVPLPYLRGVGAGLVGGRHSVEPVWRFYPDDRVEGPRPLYTEFQGNFLSK